MGLRLGISIGFTMLLNVVLASNACIGVATVAKRAPAWVGKVAYSHATNKTWGYPTDCSGYVSWLMEIGKDVKAYAWGSSSYSSALTDPINDLRFGDIFTHVYGTTTHPCSKTKAQSYISGHVFMFDKWVDGSNKTQFWAYESTETYGVTPGCKKRTEPCYNHHIKKDLSTFVKWADESCLSKTHGMVHGGPRRINTSILCPPVDNVPVRIGFYTGKGAESVGDLYRMVGVSGAQAFGSSGYTLTNLTSGAMVSTITRDHYDIVVFPGGTGTGQSNELGTKGRAAVRSFVQNGGGYIGTCGGAFLGLQHLLFYGYGKNGKGPEAQGYPEKCHAHGCNTSVSFTIKGLEDLDLVDKQEFQGNVTIMYHNGPVVRAEDFPSNVTLLAFFREEGAPWGLESGEVNLTGKPAITTTDYGAGRVILNSPHPEHIPGLAISAEIYAGELKRVLPKDVEPKKFLKMPPYETMWDEFVV